MAREKMTRTPGLSKTTTDADERRRRVRPRSPLVAMVSHVSQETSGPVFGIDGRRYLELLRQHADELTITNVGKLRLVSVEDLRELLSRLAVDESTATDEVDAGAETEEDDDDQPRSVDAELRRVGRVRTTA